MYIDTTVMKRLLVELLFHHSLQIHLNRRQNDVDLFRFGDIKMLYNLNSNRYKSGNVEISQKFYVGDGPFQKQTSDRTKAKYGDLVWYYTMNNHRQYLIHRG